MSRPDFKTARRHLTGNMPMGENRMADFKCEVWCRVPMDWIVQELAAWPAEQDRSSVYFRGSLEDAARLLDQMR